MFLLHIFPGERPRHLNIMELTCLLDFSHEVTFSQWITSWRRIDTFLVLYLEFLSIESLQWPSFTAFTTFSIRTFIWSDGASTFPSSVHLTFKSLADLKLWLQNLWLKMIRYTFFFTTNQTLNSAGKTSYRFYGHLLIDRGKVSVVFYFLNLCPSALFFSHQTCKWLKEIFITIGSVNRFALPSRSSFNKRTLALVEIITYLIFFMIDCRHL
jgi:hypothetical protein